MRYLLTFICFTVIFLTANPLITLAAFPIKQAPSAATLHADKKVPAVITLPTPGPYHDEERQRSPALPIISLALGATGLGSLIATADILGCALLGIGAIITGALGLRKPMRGLAIAGLTLGIIEVTVFLLIIALLIAILG